MLLHFGVAKKCMISFFVAMCFEARATDFGRILANSVSNPFLASVDNEDFFRPHMKEAFARTLLGYCLFYSKLSGI